MASVKNMNSHKVEMDKNINPKYTTIKTIVCYTIYGR